MPFVVVSSLKSSALEPTWTVCTNTIFVLMSFPIRLDLVEEKPRLSFKSILCPHSDGYFLLNFIILTAYQTFKSFFFFF